MARNDRDRKRVPKDANRRGGKKKVCFFCQDRIEWVDYKDVNLLRRYMSDRGKIRARRVSGNCAQHQREVATAIKTARELALLPYTQRAASERGGGRRGGRDAGHGPPMARMPVQPDQAAMPEPSMPPPMPGVPTPGGDDIDLGVVADGDEGLPEPVVAEGP